MSQRSGLVTLSMMTVALGLGGCRDQSANRPPGDTTIQSPSPANQSPNQSRSAPVSSLDSLIARVVIALRPLDDAFDSLPLLFRPDSGTIRADSLLMSRQASLAGRIAGLAQELDDSIYRPLSRRKDGNAADSLFRVLRAHGIWSYSAEGDRYFDLDLTKLATVAGSFVTAAAREYLRIEALEQVEPTGRDAAVTISWDSLGDRLAATDRFLESFPRAVMRDSIEYRRGWYLRAYLTGWDNTPVFAHDTKRLRPEPRASFERYLTKHRDTRSAKVVSAYLKVLAENQYRLTPAVTDFLKNQSGIP